MSPAEGRAECEHAPGRWLRDQSRVLGAPRGRLCLWTLRARLGDFSAEHDGTHPALPCHRDHRHTVDRLRPRVVHARPQAARRPSAGRARPLAGVRLQLDGHDAQRRNRQRARRVGAARRAHPRPVRLRPGALPRVHRRRRALGAGPDARVLRKDVRDRLPVRRAARGSWRPPLRAARLPRRRRMCLPGAARLRAAGLVRRAGRRRRRAAAGLRLLWRVCGRGERVAAGRRPRRCRRARVAPVPRLCGGRAHFWLAGLVRPRGGGGEGHRPRRPPHPSSFFPHHHALLWRHSPLHAPASRRPRHCARHSRRDARDSSGRCARRGPASRSSTSPTSGSC